VPALQILARLMAWAGPHPFRWWGLWLLSLIPIAAVAAMVSAAAGVSFQTARGYVLVAVAVVALLTWYLTRDTRSGAAQGTQGPGTPGLLSELAGDRAS
jgi:hypothetical protein